MYINNNLHLCDFVCSGLAAGEDNGQRGYNLTFAIAYLRVCMIYKFILAMLHLRMYRTNPSHFGALGKKAGWQDTKWSLLIFLFTYFCQKIDPCKTLAVKSDNQKRKKGKGDFSQHKF